MNVRVDLECPHCGQPIGVMFGEAGSGHPARQMAVETSVPAGAAQPASGTPSGPRCEKEGENWYVHCSKHGRHKARQFNKAQGFDGPVIKCTGEDDTSESGYCELRVPLKQAQRWIQ